MGDFEREKKFYRQQYNDLGKQFLHLQQQNTLAKRETRRLRVLLELIRDTYALSASFPSMAAIRRKFMLIVLAALGVDRVAVLTYLPIQKAFTVQGSLGFPKDMKPQFIPEKLPGEFHLMNSTSTIDPVLASLRRFMDVPYLLWTFNLRHEIAFVVGNATEDKMLHLPFEKADREIIEDALTVLLISWRVSVLKSSQHLRHYNYLEYKRPFGCFFAILFKTLAKNWQQWIIFTSGPAGSA